LQSYHQLDHKSTGMFAHNVTVLTTKCDSEPGCPTAKVLKVYSQCLLHTMRHVD